MSKLGRATALAWTWLRRYYAIIYSLTMLALIAIGQIGGTKDRLIDLTSWWKLPALSLGAALLLFKLLRYFRRPGHDSFDTIELGLVFMAVVNAIVQCSGPLAEQLFPINYILVVLIVAFSSIGLGLGFSALLIGVELAQKLLAGAEPDALLVVLYHLCFMLLFTLGLGIFLKLERDSVTRAETVLTKLQQDASDMAQRTKTHDELVSLSRDEKDLSTVRKVFSLDDELYSVLETVRRVFGAYSAVLLLLDTDGESLRVRSGISDSDNLCDIELIKLSATALGWTIKHAEPLALPALRDSEQLGYYKRRERVRSVLAAPVIGAEAPLGVLVVDSLEENAFQPSEGRVLGQFAQLAAHAFDRAQSMAELESERTEFAAFFKVSQGLTSSLELADLGRIVLDSAAKILDYDSGLMVLADEPSGRGWIESARGRAAEELGSDQFNIDDGLVGWSIANKRVLAYADYREWERSLNKRRRLPLLAQDVRLREVGSLLCAPLVHQDRGIGAIVMIWRHARNFTDFEQKIMRVFADQCSQALVNSRMYLRMEQMATTDGLTGLSNHRIFQEFLTHEMNRAERLPTRISLVMVDIDHFKKVNDTYGHPVGDRVLRALADLLKNSVRRVDLAARYGGEEFALVLLDTASEGTIKFSERLRKAVAALRIPLENDVLRITISIGIACYPEDALTKVELIELADQALYFSKENGRNRVTHIRQVPAESA